MVGSVERIEQEIAAIDKAVVEMAEEFYGAYANYLVALGQAVRQQLILASYNVCTQGYPEAFLTLSYSQRQQLQEMLRRLGQQIQEELLAHLHRPGSQPIEADEALPFSESHPPESTPMSPVSSEMPLTNQQTKRRSLTPMHVIQWQQVVEQAIADELHTASHATNRLLQQAGILPQKLPEPLLEAASKAEPPEMSGNTPNLLTLLVDTGNESPSDQHKSAEFKGHSVMHIVAIHLRLVEVEFADAVLTAARTRIRSLLAQLKTIGREYQKKQRERAIAEAQAAWRATWVED